jgi:hypothetical protein
LAEQVVNGRYRTPVERFQEIERTHNRIDGWKRSHADLQVRRGFYTIRPSLGEPVLRRERG